MSRNRKIAILLALIVVLVIAAPSIGRLFSKPVSGNKELETGGPTSVVIENDYKLNALLAPPQFFAVKDIISDYVLRKVNPDVRSANIINTKLNPDGSIDLDVVAGKQGSFSAKIYQPGGQVIFRVPASGYQTVLSPGEIELKYSGGD